MRLILYIHLSALTNYIEYNAQQISLYQKHNCILQLGNQERVHSVHKQMHPCGFTPRDKLTEDLIVWNRLSPHTRI